MQTVVFSLFSHERIRGDDMTIKRIFSKSIRKLNKSEFSDFVTDFDISYKQEILLYLKRFPVFAFTSLPVNDIYTNQEVLSANNAHSDGEYTWYESEIYHFEKYNLKLNDDFIEYVLDKIRN